MAQELLGHAGLAVVERYTAGMGVEERSQWQRTSRVERTLQRPVTDRSQCFDLERAQPALAALDKPYAACPRLRVAAPRRSDTLMGGAREPSEPDRRVEARLDAEHRCDREPMTLIGHAGAVTLEGIARKAAKAIAGEIALAIPPRAAR